MPWGTKYGLAVFHARSDEDIEVFGRSRFGVNADRISAYNQVFNAMLVERE